MREREGEIIQLGSLKFRVLSSDTGSYVKSDGKVIEGNFEFISASPVTEGRAQGAFSRRKDSTR